VFCMFFNEIGFECYIVTFYSILCRLDFPSRSFFVPFSWINVR
jgi:hypothetical protein